MITTRFGVDVDKVSIAKLLKALRHPKQDTEAVETFEKLFRPNHRERENAAGRCGAPFTAKFHHLLGR